MTKKKETSAPNMDAPETPKNVGPGQSAPAPQTEAPGTNDGEDGPIAPPPPAGPMGSDLNKPNDPNAEKVIPGTPYTEEKASALREQLASETLSVVEDRENGNYSIGSVVLSQAEFDNIQSLGFVKDGKFIGDPKDFKPEQYVFVTEQDLKDHPQLGPAGVVVGETRKSAMAKIEAHAESQKNGGQQSAQTNVNEGNPNTGEGPANATDQQNPPPADENKEKPKSKGKKVVYHGDYLSSNQLGNSELDITYDWDEVTAPEHLVFKPQD